MLTFRVISICEENVEINEIVVKTADDASIERAGEEFEAKDGERAETMLRVEDGERADEFSDL